MPEYLSPGVYVEEFDSGAVPMEGVSTSTAGFVGLAERGPVVGLPVLVSNFGEFQRKFGGYLSEKEFGEYRYLAYAVQQFFVNGGSRAFIMRVAPTDAKIAVYDEESSPIKVYAKDPGAWGNKISVRFTPSSKAKSQILEVIEDSSGTKKYKLKNSAGFNVGDVVVFKNGDDSIYNFVTGVEDSLLILKDDFDLDVVDTQLLPQKTIATCEVDIEVKYEDLVEAYEFVSLNSTSSYYITNKLAKSDLVNIEVTLDEQTQSPFQAISGEEEGTFKISLKNGTNGTKAQVDSQTFVGEDKGPNNRTGIQAFISNDQVSIMAVPGITDPNVQLNLVAHCENLGSRFAVLDIPQDKKTVPDVLSHRDIFDSQYAAMYHPWLVSYDPLAKKNTSFPPSGTILGIYSRTDQVRGVHKAPANEVVNGCIGLDCQYNKGEQDILNPKGVNLIRSFQGQGMRVWGARTCSSNALWKYVNVRRLFIFLEESIKAYTNWVVFEPNDQILWARVRRTIEGFLTDVWRAGALAGTSPDEAFFVDIGRTTMSQDDIDNGRLICVIGVAPVKPAEFVIFRITQKTNEQ